MSTTQSKTKVTDLLAKSMADSYTLLQIAHIYHWNVVGPQFIRFHEFFEEQYRELFEAVDELAERLRALDVLAPTSLAELRGLSTIGDIDGKAPAMDMIAGYLKASQTVIDGLKALAEAAGESGDVETEDLAIGRVQVHEKTAWMLRSILK